MKPMRPTSIVEAIMVGQIIKQNPDLRNHYVAVYNECRLRGLEVSFGRVRVLMKNLMKMHSRSKRKQ